MKNLDRMRLIGYLQLAAAAGLVVRGAPRLTTGRMCYLEAASITHDGHRVSGVHFRFGRKDDDPVELAWVVGDERDQADGASRRREVKLTLRVSDAGEVRIEHHVETPVAASDVPDRPTWN